MKSIIVTLALFAAIGDWTGREQTYNNHRNMFDSMHDAVESQISGMEMIHGHLHQLIMDYHHDGVPLSVFSALLTINQMSQNIDLANEDFSTAMTKHGQAENLFTQYEQSNANLLTTLGIIDAANIKMASAVNSLEAASDHVDMNIDVQYLEASINAEALVWIIEQELNEYEE